MFKTAIFILTLLLVPKAFSEGIKEVDSETHSKAKLSDLELNPLIPFSKQLKEFEKECYMDPRKKKECDKKVREYYKEFVDLKMKCRLEPDDERCGSITAGIQRNSYIHLFCEENPMERRCVDRREARKRAEKYKRELCRKQPELNICSYQGGDKDILQPQSLAEYCKLYPEKSKCRYMREQKAKEDLKKPKESFNF